MKVDVRMMKMMSIYYDVVVLSRSHVLIRRRKLFFTILGFYLFSITFVPTEIYVEEVLENQIKMPQVIGGATTLL